MSTDLDKLLNYLEVEQIDKYLFIGNSPSRPKRIFGGQVLAQALNAAINTVEPDRTAHSLHGYFLRGGDPTKQIVFEVDPIRDGRSFTTRRVVAKQDGRAIFNTSISFQLHEEGLSHQAEMPDVPGPEGLETDNEYWQMLAKKYPDKFEPPRMTAIERRVVERRDYLNPQPTDPVQHMWFRALGDVGDNPARHQTLLAYMSDFALLSAALLPHPYTGQSEGVQVASLDHAIWFHKPVKANEYLLYTMDSPYSGGSRGFSRGSFYSQSGELVASTTQESLVRLRTKS
ncbi:MAG: acyl-CoA thioesterase II [Halioglobus sp.]